MRKAKIALIVSLVFVFMFNASVIFGNDLPPLQKKIFDARNKVMPALVHIQPVVTDFRTGKMVKQSVVGSGVIFHPDGYVVTNYHVAGKAERIVCTLGDKEQVKAELVGGDPSTDLAIIKLDLSEYDGKLNIAEFGDSDTVQVGQYVMAMGSPLALSRSVSCGVISTTDRYFPGETRLPSGERTGKYNNWIQTDAAINPGNSGGPLVDLGGKVIGINSRASVFANNIGFAIPVNIVKEVVGQILDNGKVLRSWIGVRCQALQDLEGWFGTTRNEGVLVASIDTRSPAEEAGLEAGDIILELNGNPVSARFEEQLPDFYKEIADFPIGSEIKMMVQRGENSISLNVLTHELGEIMGEDLECKEWGFTVKAITKQMAVENQLDDTLGVYVAGVKRVGSGADGNLIRGDIIKEINEIDIDNFQVFYNMFIELTDAKTDRILLTVESSGNTRYILLKVDHDETSQNEVN
ncbi:MAG: PDZ domain-containing protein [candidate division Zixibacteria bacterium]|nr:PDZ domain-containing protein [candidate division Zixibacteria bacterium]